MTQMSNTDTVVVSIVNIEANSVTVKMRTGGKFSIPINGATLPEVPAVGDLWLATEVYPRHWTLVSCYKPGREISLMKFGVVLNASTCVGIEDTVIHNVTSAGFSEAFISVGSAGQAWWNSTAASNYGVTVMNDELTDLAKRATEAGQTAYAVIDGDMLVGNYRQQAFVSGTMPTPTITPVSMTSPFGSTDAMIALLNEVIATPNVSGVVLRGFHYHDRTCDYSPAIVADYHTKTGVYPPVAVDTTSAAFWKWEDYRESLWTSFFSTVRAGLEGGQFFVLEPEGMWLYRAPTDGRIDLGLSDTFCDSGVFDSAGIALSSFSTLAGSSSDEEIVLGAFEFVLALSKRLSSQSVTFTSIQVPLANVSQNDLDKAVSLSVNYGVSHFIVSDYDAMLAMRAPYATRADLKSTLSSYGTRIVNSRGVAGFLCSSDSRDISQTGAGVYALTIEKSVAEFCASTDYIVEVMFDSDLLTLSSSDVRSLVMLDAQNMSAVAVQSVQVWKALPSSHFVAVSRCGNKVGRSTTDTGVHPFWGYALLNTTTPAGTEVITLAASSPILPGAQISASGWRGLTFDVTPSLISCSDNFSMLSSSRNVLIGVNIHEVTAAQTLLWRSIAYTLGRSLNEVRQT